VRTARLIVPDNFSSCATSLGGATNSIFRVKSVRLRGL
jgi:hypothetical protein